MRTSTGQAVSLSVTRRSSGRMPMVTLVRPLAFRAAATGSGRGTDLVPRRMLPSMTGAVMMFMAGDPMNPATNTLFGVS